MQNQSKPTSKPQDFGFVEAVTNLIAFFDIFFEPCFVRLLWGDCTHEKVKLALKHFNPMTDSTEQYDLSEQLRTENYYKCCPQEHLS